MSRRLRIQVGRLDRTRSRHHKTFDLCDQSTHELTSIPHIRTRLTSPKAVTKRYTHSDRPVLKVSSVRRIKISRSTICVSRQVSLKEISRLTSANVLTIIYHLYLRRQVEQTHQYDEMGRIANYHDHYRIFFNIARDYATRRLQKCVETS